MSDKIEPSSTEIASGIMRTVRHEKDKLREKTKKVAQRQLQETNSTQNRTLKGRKIS